MRAGQENLYREVRWAHAISDPATVGQLRGGELVFLGRKALLAKADAAQAELLDGLVSNGVCGLVVLAGKRGSVIAPQSVARAEEAGLPLIELTGEIQIIEVLESVQAHVLRHQADDLEAGVAALDEMVKMALGGGTVEEALEFLATFASNPVVLENGRRELLGYAAGGADSSEVLSVWRVAEEGVAEIKDREILAEAVPLGPRQGNGRLLLLPLNGPVSGTDRFVMARAASIAGLFLMQVDQEEALSYRTRGDFLAELASGKLDISEIVSMAVAMGFDEKSGSVPVSIRAVGAAADESVLSWTRLSRELGRVLAEAKIPYLIGVRSSPGELLLVASSSPGGRAKLAEKIAAATHAAVRRWSPQTTAVITVGALAGWETLRGAFADTLEAADAAESIEPRYWHDATEPDLDRLLWQLRDHPALKTFVRIQLEGLVEHDRNKAHQLLPTLESLSRHGGNKSETAKELFLARQALYDRIRRISEIVGRDVTTSEGIAITNLAVRAMKFTGLP